MKIRSIGLMIGASLLVLAGAAPAMAQASDPAQPLPPRDYNLDANGVDLATGKLYLGSTDLTIGASGNGIAYSRTRRALGTDDDYVTSLTINARTIDVAIGAARDTFAIGGGNSIAGTGARLTVGSAGYIYMQADGTKFEFVSGVHSERYRIAPYRVVSIAMPDGRVLAIAYDIATVGGCVSNHATICETQYQISRPSVIRSNDGYQMVLTYQSDTTVAAGSNSAWFAVAGVTASNRAMHGGDWPSHRYTVDAARRETHTDPMNRATVTTTDGAGRITGIALPGDGAASVAIDYDGAGRVASVTTGGGTWRYAYADTTTERTTTVTSPTALKQVAVSLLSSGKILRTWSGTAPPQRFEYDGKGRVTNVVAPEGNRTVFEYDGDDNAIRQTVFAKDGSSRSTAATFDCAVVINCHKPTSTIDAKRQVTHYEYSAVHGGVTLIRRPAAAAGQPRPEQRFDYQPLYAWYRGADADGYLFQATSPIWKLTATSTCASGSAPACIGTAAETRTEIAYGTPGTPNNLLPTSVTVRAGDHSASATTGFTYDALGNVASITDARGNTSNVYYNAARQVTGATGADPDGSGPLDRPAVDISYGADGQVVARTQGRVNAQGVFTVQQQIQIAYDGYHRKVRESVVAGQTIEGMTQFGYDPDGRLVCTAIRMDPGQWAAQTDACTPQLNGPNGPDRVEQRGFDAAGRLSVVASAFGTAAASTESMSHTVSGQIASLTDGNGNVTSYAYDAFDRLATTTYPGGSSEALSYDANGNVTSRRLRDGRVVDYGYDALDRMLHKSPQGVRGVAYGYDLQGRLIEAAYDGLGGPDAVTMRYDALGRMTSTTSTLAGTGRSLSYRYDAAGNRTRITHPDGVYFDMAFDALDRVKTANWWAPTVGTVPFLDITYDQQGRRQDINRASSFTGYGYDAISRLSELNQRFARGAGNGASSLRYNPAGQIARRTQGDDAYVFADHRSVDRPYAANALNQYGRVATNTYRYDANGNLISDGGVDYAYDPENRLIAGPNGVTLAYDPLGRLWQTASAIHGKTRFLYDGEHVVAEYDGDTGALRRRYMWGPGADEPILADEGGAMNCSGTKFLHTDERGSVVATADCWGNRIAVDTYDEFGVPGADNAAVNAGGRFGYTGQAWLPELGLWYYKARIYSPMLGRFMQPDPIGYGDGLNMYGYVGGDPINKVDPSGLARVECRSVVSYVYTNPFFPGSSYAQTSQVCVNVFAPSDFAQPVRGGGVVGGGGGGRRPAPEPDRLPAPHKICGTGSSGGVRDFLWGAGDVALLGFGDDLREALGVDSVDMNSTAYTAGEIAGSVALLASGVGGGIRAAGVAARGLEFSHFIPARLGGARSIWNGNFVPIATHALSDPFRYKFMPRSWKSVNPMPNRASQLWTRTPYTAKGAAVGAGAAGTGLVNSGC